MKVLFWLLHPDPRSRATIKDLKKDKWTNQSVDDTQLNFDTVLGTWLARLWLVIMRCLLISPNCCYCLGHVSDCPDGPGAHAQHAQIIGAASLVKSNSEGKVVQLSRSMMEQLVVSEKAEKDWC